MSDLISRDAVMEDLNKRVKAVRSFDPRDWWISSYTGALHDIADDVRAIPSASPRWIPVSERLPDDLAEVNVTWVNHKPESYYESIKDEPFTATAVFYRGKWYWWTTYTQDLLAEYGERYNLGLMDEAIEVIAWMPLPKPWKGENNG